MEAYCMMFGPVGGYVVLMEASVRLMEIYIMLVGDSFGFMVVPGAFFYMMAPADLDLGKPQRVQVL